MGSKIKWTRERKGSYRATVGDVAVHLLQCMPDDGSTGEWVIYFGESCMGYAFELKNAKADVARMAEHIDRFCRACGYFHGGGAETVMSRFARHGEDLTCGGPGASEAIRRGVK